MGSWGKNGSTRPERGDTTACNPAPGHFTPFFQGPDQVKLQDTLGRLFLICTSPLRSLILDLTPRSSYF